VDWLVLRPTIFGVISVFGMGSSAILVQADC